MTDRDISRGERRGSRLPARARIVGWIVLTAALGLLALIVTVHSALQAGVARQANAQVEQELAEFDAFVSEGRDPRTGRAFGDVRDVFDVYSFGDICTIGTTIVNVAAAKTIGSPGIKLYNGTCLLHNIMASATTATFMSGSLAVMEK